MKGNKHKHHRHTKSSRIRASIAQEAARLMREEGISEYYNAKRVAARRLFGKEASALRYRPSDLPSNGEIRDALLQLTRLHEGELQEERLFAMRLVALDTMEELPSFFPRLIGSVSTGHVRQGSDIDLHVFTDDLAPLLTQLATQRWDFEQKQVTIRAGNTFRDYTHVYIDRGFPIELSVYACHERRIRQTSSTDGKAIIRISPTALRYMIWQEHETLCEQYLPLVDDLSQPFFLSRFAPECLTELTQSYQHDPIQTLAEREWGPQKTS